MYLYLVGELRTTKPFIWNRNRERFKILLLLIVIFGNVERIKKLI
jgi:hypothetical protein